jgi:hypothetical protein
VRRRLAVLLHPAFIGAVVVLALNDHVFKGRFPGWWTGKLSDFAGVFIVALFAGWLSRRPITSAILTGTGFCVLKLWAPAANLAAPALGGVTRLDPSDLVALVALLPAAGVASRIRSSYPPRTVIRSVVMVVSGTAAILALTATSCAEPIGVNGFAVTADGTVFAHSLELFEEPGDPGSWARSADGGRTWSPQGSAPDGADAKETRVCVGDRCFEVRGDRVLETGGGTTRTAFPATAEDRRPRQPRQCPSHSELSAITAVHQPDGVHVVVSAGEDGVLHRSPAGDWERRPVLQFKPRPFAEPGFFKWFGLAPPAAILASLWSVVVSRRRWGPRGAWRGFAVGALSGLGVITCAGLFQFAGWDARVTLPLMLVGSLASFAAGMLVSIRPPKPIPHPRLPIPPPS